MDKKKKRRKRRARPYLAGLRATNRTSIALIPMQAAAGPATVYRVLLDAAGSMGSKPDSRRHGALSARYVLSKHRHIDKRLLHRWHLPLPPSLICDESTGKQHLFRAGAIFCGDFCGPKHIYRDAHAPASDRGVLRWFRPRC